MFELDIDEVVKELDAALQHVDNDFAPYIKRNKGSREVSVVNRLLSGFTGPYVKQLTGIISQYAATELAQDQVLELLAHLVDMLGDKLSPSMQRLGEAKNRRQ
ncbi:unnamed protein product [Calypogeia fissa]